MAARLLDTNIVSYLVKNHSLAQAYQSYIAGFALYISFQTLAELQEGAKLASWGPAKRARLAATLSRVVVLHSDDDICDRWAEVRAGRKSRPIGVADAWIAATALAFNLELVTHNAADFQAIPGLVVITLP